MSDVSGGAGWWMASDGKWYPPELHPDARTTARAAGVAASGSPTSGSAVPQQAQPAQQWTAAGIGASSGGLPPFGGMPPMAVAGPEGAGFGIPGPGAVPGWGGPQAPAQPDAQPGIPGQASVHPGYAPLGYGQGFDYQGFSVPGGGPLAGGRRSRRPRPLVLGVGAVTVVIAVVGALFGTGVLTPASIGLPLGSGSAVINWPSGTPPQMPSFTTGILPHSAFTGVIAGKTVRGTGGISAELFGVLFGGTDNAPADITFFTASGTLGSTQFSVDVDVPKAELNKLGVAGSGTPPPGTVLTFDVSGRYGKFAIKGTLSGDAGSAEPPLHFDVTIGPVRATGTIIVDSGSNRATATYSLS